MPDKPRPGCFTLGKTDVSFDRLSGLQRQSGYGGGEENFCPCEESNSELPSLVSILTKLFHIFIFDSEESPGEEQVLM